MGSARLGAGMKNGVAATNISPDGMGFADAVAESDAVMVAGTATGEVIFALRKKGGKDAVFHMKHRDVLVKGEFEPRGWGGVEEFE